MSKLLLELNIGPKGLESIHVPDGFEVAVAVAPGLVTYPMFFAFDDRGRLFVCESAVRNIGDQEMDRQPEMRIRLLEDTDGDGVFDRSRIFADKISMAMGGAVVSRQSLRCSAAGRFAVYRHKRQWRRGPPRSVAHRLAATLDFSRRRIERES
jgi:glucose/arabinose dehydrogenase